MVPNISPDNPNNTNNTNNNPNNNNPKDCLRHSLLYL